MLGGRAPLGSCSSSRLSRETRVQTAPPAATGTQAPPPPPLVGEFGSCCSSPCCSCCGPGWWRREAAALVPSRSLHFCSCSCRFPSPGNSSRLSQWPPTCSCLLPRPRAASRNPGSHYPFLTTLRSGRLVCLGLVHFQGSCSSGQDASPHRSLSLRQRLPRRFRPLVQRPQLCRPTLPASSSPPNPLTSSALLARPHNG